MIKNIYVSIRQFIQPYYVNKDGVKPFGEWLKDKKEIREKNRTKNKKSKKTKTIKVEKHTKGVTKKTDGRIKILSVDGKLNLGQRFKNIPKINTIWTYYGGSTIQALGHFEKGAGFRYVDRSSNRRRKLRPKIYPKQDAPFDRTHLIPFGYHNSEADNRLLVGWDSEQNQTTLNNFEQEMKKLPNDILWLTIIDKKDFGATWKYRIYDAKTRKVLGKLDLELDREMVWRWN